MNMKVQFAKYVLTRHFPVASILLLYFVLSRTSFVFHELNCLKESTHPQENRRFLFHPPCSFKTVQFTTLCICLHIPCRYVKIL